MTTLRFTFDWDDPGEAKGAELRATWSRFEITVGEEPITRVTDLLQRSVRNHIYVPLYPFAEWVAENWFFLNFEARAGEYDRNYEKRHFFGAIDPAYSFPGLSIMPTGRLAELSWKRSHFRRSMVEYLSAGTTVIPLADVTNELRALLDAIHGRLLECGVEDTRFQTEWKAIADLKADELDFARMAASSGLDPFDIEDNEESAIVLLSDQLSLESLSKFLTATRGSKIQERAKWLQSSLSELDKLTGGLEAIPSIAKRSTSLRLNQKKKQLPFEWGYDVARKIRASVGKLAEPIPSAKALASLFDAGRFEDSVLVDDEGRSKIKSLSTNDRYPRFKIFARHPNSDTFALARGIFDEITTPELGINIVADTDIEGDKASRAFAAEFLLPSSVLKERAKRGTWYEEDISEIADEFHVSEFVVKHQIENHHLGTVVH